MIPPKGELGGVAGAGGGPSEANGDIPEAIVCAGIPPANGGRAPMLLVAGGGGGGGGVAAAESSTDSPSIISVERTKSPI